MTADELRARQAPLKQRYRDRPEAALISVTARGRLDVPRVACRIETSRTEVIAGLHPAAGGDGACACAAEQLLESLIGCAGTTLCAVVTALGIPVTGGELTAVGRLDIRGTLGVDRSAPVGLTGIELSCRLETTATPEQLDKLAALTERYCVVMQSLRTPTHLVLQHAAP